MALLKNASPRPPLAEIASPAALGRADAEWAHPAEGFAARAFGAADVRAGASLRHASLPLARSYATV